LEDNPDVQQPLGMGQGEESARQPMIRAVSAEGHLSLLFISDSRLENRVLASPAPGILTS